MIELILTIVCVVLLFIIIGILLVVLRKKEQNQNLEPVIKEIKQDNEKILMQTKLENESVIRLFSESNASFLKYIKDYNEAIRKGLEQTYNMQLNLLKDVEKRINDVLKNNDSHQEKLKQSLEQSIEKLQSSNEKKLEEMRLTVDEKLQSTLEKRINTSFTQVSERLEQVYKGLGEMRNLAGDVGDLKKVLSNVKTRGTWGEVQLGNLLEQMLSPEQFASQVMLDKNSIERVDFVVKMPGKDNKEVLLPIDAKYPIESYQRLVENSEQNDVKGIETNSKELEKTIKAYAKDISQKYIKVPTTTDFAIMYLPIEGLYAEVIKNTTLVQMLQRDFRIMVCGPTTLAALLNSLQMGFRTLAIEKRSSEVWALLSLFKSEFSKFYDLLLKTQKKLLEASNTIDDATKKTKTIERKLRTVDSLEPPHQDGLVDCFDDDNN